MFLLEKSLQAFGSPEFESTFKRETEQLDARLLPLQQGLSVGGYALYDFFKVMMISVQKKGGTLQIKTGVFYHGVISGCSCADDPSPTDETNEYCELVFTLNRLTKKATVALAIK